MTDEELEKAARQYLKPRFNNDACRCMLLPWDKVEEYCVKTLADFTKQCISKQWISVDERLPENDDHVLVHVKGDRFFCIPDRYEVAYYDTEDWYTQDGELIRPTHWCDIPPLNPEKEER